MPTVSLTSLPHDQQRAVMSFLTDHGRHVPNHELGFILDLDEREVERVKERLSMKHQAARKPYVELFSLWRGRAPGDEEWPQPRIVSSQQSYEWQAPEITLLASLIGRMGTSEIAAVLTARLRKVTGDVHAERTVVSIHNMQTHLGLFSSDVVGGITVNEAGKRVGSAVHVRHAIRNGDLPASKVGRLLVIPRPAFEAWVDKRQAPPAGYVQLSTLRERLGIQSDKLSEFARAGQIPTAIRCKVSSANMRTTQFGTWFVSEEVAEKMLADRREGLPMPWHGKPQAENLRRTYDLWLQRRHPKNCKQCAEIWGKAGAPKTYEQYESRYSPLSMGAKRHLTKPWTPGLGVNEVAVFVGRQHTQVRRAIENGVLRAASIGEKHYVSRTDATRWKSIGCPTGERAVSWLSLKTAEKQFGFKPRQLRRFIKDGVLMVKIGDAGPLKGIEVVSRRQCSLLREALGFSVVEAARRAGVTVEQLLDHTNDLGWRKADGVPLQVIQNIIQRRQSERGYSVEQAAERLGKPVAWVQQMIDEGVVKVARAKWKSERLYFTKPMFARLEAATKGPVRPERLPDDWKLLSISAADAGVSASTLIKWATAGEVERRQMIDGWRYHQPSVRRRARQYWATEVSGRGRRKPPAWLAQVPAGRIL